MMDTPPVMIEWDIDSLTKRLESKKKQIEGFRVTLDRLEIKINLLLEKIGR